MCPRAYGYFYTPEVVSLEDTAAKEVIVHIQAILARHGIPDTAMADNGLQFSGCEVAVKYNFAM